MKNLYEILGVAKDALQDVIKKAHRQGVKEHHPDKGGNQDKFREIQHAYNVLINEQRRKKYDETGDDTETLDEFTSRFVSFIESEIVGAIEQAKSIEFDVMAKAKKQLSAEIVNITEGQQAYEKGIERLEKARLKVTMKTEGKNNFIVSIMDEKIKMYRSKQSSLEESANFCNKAMEELEDYIYSFVEEPQDTATKFESWLSVKMNEDE